MRRQVIMRTCFLRKPVPAATGIAHEGEGSSAPPWPATRRAKGAIGFRTSRSDRIEVPLAMRARDHLPIGRGVAEGASTVMGRAAHTGLRPAGHRHGQVV